MLLIGIIASLQVVAASNLTVHYIGIGQGDATLITYKNWTILVDSGERFIRQKEKMESYLAGLNVTTINQTVATHADADHIGQFTNLARSRTY